MMQNSDIMRMIELYMILNLKENYVMGDTVLYFSREFLLDFAIDIGD